MNMEKWNWTHSDKLAGRVQIWAQIHTDFNNSYKYEAKSVFEISQWSKMVTLSLLLQYIGTNIMNIFISIELHFVRPSL